MGARQNERVRKETERERSKQINRKGERTKRGGIIKVWFLHATLTSFQSDINSFCSLLTPKLPGINFSTVVQLLFFHCCYCNSCIYYCCKFFCYYSYYYSSCCCSRFSVPFNLKLFIIFFFYLN